MIRALIVEDEALAREGLRMLLAREPDVELVGEAANAPDAVARILAERPDLLLLDVQIPGGDGFEVLERVAHAHLPEVIFVTAYDRHALRAFDVNALDYLLKPVRDERFSEAIERARRELATTDERAGPARLTAMLDARLPAAPNRVAVREGGRYVLVKLDDVEWIRSAANYVELHLGSRMHLLRATLRDMEARLDGRRFVRIHRTLIVDTTRIDVIEPTDGGDFVVVLADGTRLPMSRTHRASLLP